MKKILINGNIVEVSDEEKKAYDRLVKDFGGKAFENTISVENGEIVFINPYGNETSRVSYAIMWFLITTSIQQRLRKMDSFEEFLNNINDRIDELSEKVEEMERKNK